MAKSRTRQRSRAKLDYSTQPVAGRARSIFLPLLAASFVLPIMAMLILAAFNVPLGESAKLIYRYSPIREERSFRALPALLVLVPLTVFVVRQTRRAIAWLGLFLVLAGTWMWFAPPASLAQHEFNFISPAQDGAFVFETIYVRDARSYLDSFDDRVRRSVLEAGGSRVISNPPGLTLLGHAIGTRQLDFSDPLQRLIRDRLQMGEEEIPIATTGIRLAMLLHVVWMLSGTVAYALARLFCSRAGAIAFAIVVAFNACTVHFTPGKDSAQLLLINAMLFAWFGGWKLNKPWMSLLAGAVFAIAMTFTLLTMWIALVAASTCGWRGRRHLLFTAIGAAFTVIAISLMFDWNMLATLWTLSRRFGEIQRELGFNRPLWFLIGLPIFVLFVSPAIWTFAAMRLRRHRRWEFGERLLIATLTIMLVTYVIGVQYELPRLWIAFWPTLVLGLMLTLPMSRANESPRAARLLATVAAMHVAFAIAHWTMLDAREAEHRLIQKTIFKLDR